MISRDSILRDKMFMMFMFLMITLLISIVAIVNFVILPNNDKIKTELDNMNCDSIRKNLTNKTFDNNLGTNAIEDVFMQRCLK